ncbi:hypothetical protein Taro_028091 [Colocasia esculenta]|uniref:Cyclin D1 n=1 Tax=Colocasia esculenta TaxID=4460 RepID=A0A843VT76_COLES|nr:hypothetical protein [Colocasia esculenta]
MPLSSSSSGHPHQGLFSSSASDEHSNDLLLCGEDASSLSDDERLVPLFPPGSKCPAGVDEDVGEEDGNDVAAAWVGIEADHFPEMDYRSRFRPRSGNLDPAARLRSVAWILKVAEFYQFQPVTAYLAVNYMDRFLSRHALPQQPGGWPVQLLAVACLSLAAKMEETLVPSLLDLQVEGARFVFEPRTIQRMELLVLDAVNWRLRSITPFAFLGFFACKADPGRSLTGYLISRATRIILATTEEIEFLGHCPSAVAAAAVACSAREAPALSSISPESAASWCAGLTREGIVNCYQLMQELVLSGSGQHKQQRRSRIPPLQGIKLLGSEVLSSSSSPPSSASKRRKLSSRSWVDDGKGAGRRTEEGDDIN